jgi:hypothetical protein
MTTPEQKAAIDAEREAFAATLKFKQLAEKANFAGDTAQDYNAAMARWEDANRRVEQLKA